MVNQKSLSACGKAVLLSAIVAFMCSSCASSRPSREDGIVGLVYSVVSKDGKEEPRQVKQGEERRWFGLFGKRNADDKKREDREEVKGPPAERYATTGCEYRLSPGDRIAVSFFQKPFRTTPGDYRIDCGDHLTITAHGPKPVTKDVKVRMDGKISFFLIEEITVKGLTVAEASGAIQNEIRRSMPSASITVFLKAGHMLARSFLDDIAGPGDEVYTRVTVRPDGVISLPIIGEHDVSGMTIANVAASAQQQYDNLFNEGLSVSLSLLTERKNTAILGEVKNPGTYALYEPVHPLFAIAMAGGRRETSRDGKIVLLKRCPEGGFKRHYLNLKTSSLAKNHGHTGVLMEPDDILIVPKSGIANLNKWVTQYIRNMLPVPGNIGAHYSIVN